MQAGFALLLPMHCTPLAHLLISLTDFLYREGLSQSGLPPVPPLRPGQVVIISRRVMGSTKMRKKNIFMKLMLISGEQVVAL